MSGDAMSIESKIQRIDDVVKGLTSIKDKKILEWASTEDWSVGIGIGLLNDYKEILLDKQKETNKDDNLKETMQKILSSKCRGIDFNKYEEPNENMINILKETTINITEEFLKSEIETTSKTLCHSMKPDDETMKILIDKVLNDDELWNNFHFNLGEIIQDHFK